MLIYPDEIEEAEEIEEIPDYPVHLFFTEGAISKDHPSLPAHEQSRSSRKATESPRRWKPPTIPTCSSSPAAARSTRPKPPISRTPRPAFWAITSPARLGMEEGETAVFMAVTREYDGYMLFFFENGKLAKVDMNAYATKTNRKKLTGAYSDKSPLVSAVYVHNDLECLLTASSGRMLLVHTGRSLQSRPATPRAWRS